MAETIEQRIAGLDWPALGADILETGHARAPAVLDDGTCRALIALYGDDGRFRSRIVMARHNFGLGDYAYFAAPLPRPVAALRAALYPRLAPIANRMAAALRGTERYPKTLTGFLRRCHGAGQTKPTPLILRYGAGGYNRLHRDLYGDIAFPLQAVVMLSRPGRDYDGGEFLLVENRPRQQAIGTAFAAGRGDMILFANAARPVQGARGWLRAHVRHGVSRVTRGERYALGIIFHDAA